jgi:hypothetical protein
MRHGPAASGIPPVASSGMTRPEDVSGRAGLDEAPRGVALLRRCSRVAQPLDPDGVPPASGSPPGLGGT